MNQPYVKQYDSDGKLLNPINGIYKTTGANRRKRREFKNLPPFVGNGKNYHLTCDGRNAYKRVLQFAKDKEGNIKKIYHYILN